MKCSLIVTKKKISMRAKAAHVVENLKNRIAKATREGNLKQVKNLQKLLYRSSSFKLVSEKRNLSQNCLAIAKEKIRSIIRQHRDTKVSVLIASLNRFIQTFCNQYQEVITLANRSNLDYFLSTKLKKAMKRKHPKKQWSWVRDKYWGSHLGGSSVFADFASSLYLLKFKNFLG